MHCGKGGYSGCIQPRGGMFAFTFNSTPFVSSTQLQLTINVSSTASLGQYDIKVVNPDGGMGRSVRCITVT